MNNIKYKEWYKNNEGGYSRVIEKDWFSIQSIKIEDKNKGDMSKWAEYHVYAEIKNISKEVMHDIRISHCFSKEKLVMEYNSGDMEYELWIPNEIKTINKFFGTNPKSGKYKFHMSFRGIDRLIDISFLFKIPKGSEKRPMKRIYSKYT